MLNLCKHSCGSQSRGVCRSVPLIRELACSKRLASMAGALLGTRRVRLYQVQPSFAAFFVKSDILALIVRDDVFFVQDCVFLKHSGYAETNWHSDLRMTPFDTNHFVTVWIPLRPIKVGVLGAHGSPINMMETQMIA